MITVEHAREALVNIETLMDNLDFAGATADGEYEYFLVQMTILNQFIQETEDREKQQKGADIL
jgi:hypothetical protein